MVDLKDSEFILVGWWTAAMYWSFCQTEGSNPGARRIWLAEEHRRDKVADSIGVRTPVESATSFPQWSWARQILVSPGFDPSVCVLYVTVKFIRPQLSKYGRKKIKTTARIILVAQATKRVIRVINQFPLAFVSWSGYLVLEHLQKKISHSLL